MRKSLLWSYILLFLFFIPTASYSQSSSFVSLSGKQFKLEGLNYFPLTLNYRVDIVRNNQGYEFVSPHHSYDSSNDYEITDGSGVLNEQDCFNQLLIDFQLIRDMGFNSVRIGGLEFEMNSLSNQPVYTSYDVNFNEQKSSIQAPYTKIFYFIQKVLEAAELKNLKVELLCGGKGVTNPSTGYLYNNYLQALATNFSNNNTLFAYDFFNEPLYFEHSLSSKGEVCAIVKSWNDIMKSSAPLQLTTVGLATSLEVLKWDPGFLDLDFLSFHIYPETNPSDGNPFLNAIDRVKSEIKWISETSLLPWVIGETGFTANSNDWDNSDMGTLQDQKNYAEQTLEFARDCGSSGYSWWQFQDVWWNNIDDYFGLLGHDNLAKPVVTAFTGFNPFTLGPIPGYPSNYFNPYGHSGYSISGYVRNSSSQPIKNALLIGKNNAYNILAKTFTDGNGHYVLYSDTPIDILYASACRSSSLIKYNASNTSSLDIVLNQFQPNDILNLTNINVTGSISNQANKNVQVSNFIVNANASSVINSSGIILLKSGFQAKKNSYFHGYISINYPDCGDISNNFDQALLASRLQPSGPFVSNVEAPSHSHEPSNENQKILVDNKNILSIYPNPNNGKFIIESSNEKISRIEILNSLGQGVYFNKNLSSTYRIDISGRPPGIYLVIVNIGDLRKSFKVSIK